MVLYKFIFLSDYVKGKTWPQPVEAPDPISAAMAAKRKCRRKAPCGVILWESATFWERKPGLLVHVGRYQAVAPRTTYVWWKPNETYPHPWHKHASAIVEAHRQGRADLDELPQR